MIGNDLYLPSGRTQSQILQDPHMTFHEKAQLINLMDAASGGERGFTTGDLTRAAAGAGMGLVGGTLAASLIGNVFGRMNPQSRKLVQATGALVGSLRNTGILK